MLCSAYVGRIGLLGSDVLFSMCQSGCVCVCAYMVVCMPRFESVMRARIHVFNRALQNTYQQSIASVIDELWQTTAAEGCAVHIIMCKRTSAYPYVGNILFSRCQCPWSHSSEHEDTQMQPKTTGLDGSLVITLTSLKIKGGT